MPKGHTSPAERDLLVAESVLRLLKKHEWRDVTLASIARSMRLPLSHLLSVVPSKAAVAGVILRALAKDTARRYRADAKSAEPRERVFETTMAFLDVQNRHSEPLKKLYRALQYDPLTLLATRNDILSLAGELLALAEADMASSPQVQNVLFAAILMRAVSAWCDDDEEMGKTMAQLDGDLHRAERLLWPKSRNIPESLKTRSEPGRRRSKRRNPA